MPVTDHPGLVIDGSQFLTMEELAMLFNYRKTKYMMESVYKGTFPIPTFKLGKRRFADPAVVREYLRRVTQQGLDELAKKKRLRVPLCKGSTPSSV